jgi:hypothetical protein
MKILDFGRRAGIIERREEVVNRDRKITMASRVCLRTTINNKQRTHSQPR